jgi:hypothetical protein
MMTATVTGCILAIRSGALGNGADMTARFLVARRRMVFGVERLGLQGRIVGRLRARHDRIDGRVSKQVNVHKKPVMGRTDQPKRLWPGQTTRIAASTAAADRLRRRGRIRR